MIGHVGTATLLCFFAADNSFYLTLTETSVLLRARGSVCGFHDAVELRQRGSEKVLSACRRLALISADLGRA